MVRPILGLTNGLVLDAQSHKGRLALCWHNFVDLQIKSHFFNHIDVQLNELIGIVT